MFAVAVFRNEFEEGTTLYLSENCSDALVVFANYKMKDDDSILELRKYFKDNEEWTYELLAKRENKEVGYVVMLNDEALYVGDDCYSAFVAFSSYNIADNPEAVLELRKTYVVEDDSESAYEVIATRKSEVTK